MRPTLTCFPPQEAGGQWPSYPERAISPLSSPPSSPHRRASLRATRTATLAAALVLAVTLLSLASPGARGRMSMQQARPSGSGLPLQQLGWNPMMLPPEHRSWVHEWVRVEPRLPSVVGRIRRQLTMELALGAVLNGVPGDFVETGVRAGGTAILLCKVLERCDPDRQRVLWAADSFQGLPEGTQQDARDSGKYAGYRGMYASTEQQFLGNLERWEVPASRVRVLKGWFNETLPTSGIDSIAFLRLDGDLYASTMDALKALYGKVSVGGMVYADDYGSFPGCKRAIDEFRAERHISAPLQWQYLPDVLFNQTEAARRGGFKWEAVWWIKTEE